MWDRRPSWGSIDDADRRELAGEYDEWLEPDWPFHRPVFMPVDGEDILVIVAPEHRRDAA